MYTIHLLLLGAHQCQNTAPSGYIIGRSRSSWMGVWANFLDGIQLRPVLTPDAQTPQLSTRTQMPSHPYDSQMRPAWYASLLNSQILLTKLDDTLLIECACCISSSPKNVRLPYITINRAPMSFSVFHLTFGVDSSHNPEQPCRVSITGKVKKVTGHMARPSNAVWTPMSNTIRWTHYQHTADLQRNPMT